MPPVTRWAAVPFKILMVSQHFPTQPGEVIDVRVEISIGNLPLLWWQAEVSSLAQRLQAAQCRVAASMRFVGAFIQEL